MATIFKQLTSNDIFTDTTKVTKGLFKNGSGSLAATSIFTQSISQSDQYYFHTITDANDQTSESYFDCFFGSVDATGSNMTSSNASDKATEAVYKQWANILLDDPYVKFAFSDVSGSDSGDSVDEIYGMVVKTDKNYNSLNFAKLISRNSHVQVVIIENQNDLRKFFVKNLIDNEIVVCMGAGSISKWLREMDL